MAVTTQQYRRLSNLAIAAAMAPEIWQEFLDAMGQTLGTYIGTQLIGYDQTSRAAPLAYTAGYDPEVLTLYQDHYADKNPYALNFPNCRIGEAVPNGALCDPRAMKRTAFYADLLHPQGDLYCGGGALLALESDHMFLIGGNIRARDQDKYEQAWVDLCALLTPVMQHSLAVNRMIEGLNFEKWAAEQHLLGGGTAVIVVDADLTIQYACGLGQTLLSCGKLFGSDGFRRLECRSVSARGGFLPHLRQQTNGNGQVFNNIRLRDADGDEWICRTMGLRLGDLARSPFGPFLTVSGAATLLAVKRLSAEVSPVKQLQNCLTLSQAEAQSVLLLAEGATPVEIAAQRSVSVYTVRNQIKAALSKADCRRQSELVRKVEQLRLLGGW